MAKVAIKSNPRVHQIFDDLESFLNFCKTFGYRYNVEDLYSNKSHIYRQYTKYLTGKPVKNMWDLDGKN